MIYLAVYLKNQNVKADYESWVPERWPVKCHQYTDREKAAIEHPEALIMTADELQGYKMALKDEYEALALANAPVPAGEEKPWWKFW